MYQHTVIVGNVGRAPELRYLPDGTAVCDFSVAVNAKWDGGERTTWFKVVCWRKLAETVNQYVTKGRQVLCTGEVGVSAYTAKDGSAAATLELTARDVKFLGQRGNEAVGDEGEVGDGDIPF